MRWFEQLGIGASNFEFDPEKQAVADAASGEVNDTVLGILDGLREAPDGSISCLATPPSRCSSAPASSST